MLENLPSYISIIFILTTLLTLLLFYKAVNKSGQQGSKFKSYTILFACLLWLSFQSIVSLNDFYQSGNDTFPPRFLVLVSPPLLVILFTFLTKSGKSFVDQLPQLELTYLHVIRIPVEIVLFTLCIHDAVPQLMTFEGRNFDILAGISAPLVAYYGIKKGVISPRMILVWNIICLVLFFNIIVHGVLSAPTLIQNFAFEQPNIALMHFPFTWLPSFIVPIVLFSHIVCIRQLSNQIRNKNSG